MSFEALLDTEGGLERAIRLAQEWSSGSKGGIVTTPCKKSDLDQFKSKAKQDQSTSRSKEGSNAWPNKVCYTSAAWRDAKYALRGRRWMRAMACTGLATLAINRAVAMNEIEDMKKREDDDN